MRWMSDHGTVDKKLVPFKRRCSFCMYMKSKLNKYRLKIMCFCNATNLYVYNTFISCGKNSAANSKKFIVPILNVLEFVTPIFNLNINILISHLQGNTSN